MGMHSHILGYPTLLGDASPYSGVFPDIRYSLISGKSSHIWEVFPSMGSQARHTSLRHASVQAHCRHAGRRCVVGLIAILGFHDVCLICWGFFKTTRNFKNQDCCIEINAFGVTFVVAVGLFIFWA